jgi:hypothetical protein
MFNLTGHIKIEGFAPFKYSSVSWDKSVDNISWSAKIVLPAIAVLKRVGESYEQVETVSVIKEGKKVEIYAGYNGKNPLQFSGFIRRRSFSSPLEIECEGYSYQLRKKKGYNKSYKSVTLKQLLSDLIEGTDIKLYDNIPDATLTNLYFKNATGLEVLEWVKNNSLMTIYFETDKMYCNLKYLEPKKTINLNLGWNTIKDNSLKFETEKDLATVKIKIIKKNADGSHSTAVNGIGEKVEEIRLEQFYSGDLMQKIAADKRKELMSNGYEGTVTCFLKPYIEPGMAVKLINNRYPDLKGTYYVLAVSGESGPSGGRQKVTIGISL